MNQSVLEKAKEAAKQAIQELALPIIEVEAEKAIMDKSDALVAHLMNKLVEAIPGQLDNALLVPALPKLQAEAKKFLLAQAEKISDKV